MADDREPYGRIFHEQGRLTVNAEREKPFSVEPWEKRSKEQRELDMRGADAVAKRAVHDAGFDQAKLAAEIIRLRVRLDDAVDGVCRRIAREDERRGNALPPSDERNAWLGAAAVALAARETGTEP